MRKGLTIGVLLGLVLAVIAVAAMAYLAPAPRPQQESSSAGEALIGGPFRLIDQHGREVTDQDYAGRFMLVFFGFTYCPDMCPMSLGVMSAALDDLSESERGRIAPLFITLDPERDGVEEMESYAALFHPELVALTGTREAVEEAAGAYRVYHARADDAEGDYLIDHSVFTYLMGPDGRYVTHFGHDTDPADMAARLRRALAEG